jgi:hypothetical protein
MAADAVRWSCARCGVSSGRIDGQRSGLPPNWVVEGRGAFCLSCRRALAGDTALESAPSDSSHEERARIRRTALIEFEIRRSPQAPNRTIAQACRTSTRTVATIRDAGDAEQAASGHRAGCEG